MKIKIMLFISIFFLVKKNLYKFLSKKILKKVSN